MIGWLEGEKAFDRNEHPFMMKTHSKLGMGGISSPWWWKSKKPTAKLIFRKSSFVTNIIYMARMFLLTTGFQHSRSPCQCNRAIKRSNQYAYWEERHKIVIHRWLEKLENSKSPRTNNYCKVAGYKINMQRPFGALHISNEQVQFEIENKIPFTLVSKYWNTFKV